MTRHATDLSAGADEFRTRTRNEVQYRMYRIPEMLYGDPGTSRICLQLRRQLSSSEDAASICRFQEFRRRVAGDCGGLFDLVEFKGCLAIERSSNGYRPLKRIGDSCTRDILLNSTLLSQESAPNRLIILLVHSALRDRDQGEDNCTSITTLLF